MRPWSSCAIRSCAARPVVIGGGRRHVPEEVVDPVTGAVARKFATLRGYAGRGVITTATYEARKFGLHSALGLMKAAALAPDAILLPTDFDRYRRYSRLFKAAVAQLAPRIEDRGIDEIYLDLTDVQPPGAGEPRPLPAQARRRETPGATARRTPARSPRSTRGGARATSPARSSPPSTRRPASPARSRWRPTSCWPRSPPSSTSPTASRSCAREDVATRVWPLPPRRINGIGPKASAKLEALGVRTIGELAHADLAWLLEHFGRNYGAWLHEAANGRDDREVVTESEPKSISRETTFERDLSVRRDREELSRVFTDLCVRLEGDLKRKGYAGRTIGIKLRFDNFTTVTRDRTLDAAHPGCAGDPARGGRVPEAGRARAADPAAGRAHRHALAEWLRPSARGRAPAPEGWRRDSRAATRLQPKGRTPMSQPCSQNPNTIQAATPMTAASASRDHAPGRVHDAGQAIAAARRRIVGDRPREEAAEQHDVGQRAVGQQVTERPHLGAEHHRMADRGLHPRAAHVAGDDQHERGQHQQRGEVARPRRRRVQHHGRLPREAEAVHDEHEADERHEREEALPALLAQAGDLRAAPGIREDAQRMRAQEYDQAGHQYGHRAAPVG